MSVPATAKTSSTVRDFRDLVVWQKAIALVKSVYKATREFPEEEKFGLVSQIRRAAVSIPSNIAEGQQRNTTTEFRRHLSIALGSLAEVETQIIIAAEINYIDASERDAFQQDLSELRRMLCGLQESLLRTPFRRGPRPS